MTASGFLRVPFNFIIPLIPGTLIVRLTHNSPQVPDTDTGMPEEASFVAQLCTIEEALERLKPREVQRHIVEIAWKAWQYTLDVDSGRVALSPQGVPPGPRDTT